MEKYRKTGRRKCGMEEWKYENTKGMKNEKVKIWNEIKK
jgi:hypothetical protein